MTQTLQSAFEARLSAASQQRFRNVLIFGAPGSGKTTFLGSAGKDPRTSPMLLLDFEGGSASLEGLPASELSVFPVRDWKDYSLAHDYLKSGTAPFRSIGVDSISETHLHSLLTIVEEAVANQGDRKRTNDLIIEQGDYGKAMVQMRRFLRSMRDLAYHTFFTAHVKSEIEPRKGLVLKPSLFGQMSEEVVGMFDTAAMLSLVNFGNEKTPDIDRALFLHGYPEYRVRTRTPYGVTLPQFFRLNDKPVTQLFDLIDSATRQVMGAQS